MKHHVFQVFLAVSLLAEILPARSFRFSVPLDSLQAWAKSAVVKMEATLEDHSGVHLAVKDCEMHFGARVTSYSGKPPGWVFEPMNICKEPFFGAKKYSKKAWLDFAEKIKGLTTTVEGVPRIWPEHLTGEEEPSNPNHGVQLHPLTRLKEGNKFRDFRKFIYAPEGFAGISEGTQESLLTTSELTAARDGDLVEIRFKTSGRIGNFATLEVVVDPKTIEELEGGHRMLGEVDLGDEEPQPVRLLSIDGSDLDKKISAMKGKAKKRPLEVLALFSLNPKAILEALDGTGSGTQAREPVLQLILYGVTDQDQ